MLIGFLVSAQVAMRALKKQFWELGDEVLQDSSTQINLSLVDSSKEWMVWGWLKRAMSSTWWAIILQRRQWQSWRDNEPRRLETNWSFLTQIIDASWIGFCEGVMMVRSHDHDIRIQKLALLATSSSWLGSMLMFLGWMTGLTAFCSFSFEKTLSCSAEALKKKGIKALSCVICLLSSARADCLLLDSLQIHANLSSR